jgi:hypothetical protein
LNVSKYVIAVLLILLGVLWISHPLWAGEAKAGAKTKAKAVAQNAYIGDTEKKCGMCHKAQVDAWKKWPMAKAWDKLSAKDKQNESCIKCHVTGYGKEGGWVSIKNTPGLAGVQCEACHGPAAQHLKAPMGDKAQRRATMKTPDETTCKACHIKQGNPHFKGFRYRKLVKALADHLPKK